MGSRGEKRCASRTASCLGQAVFAESGSRLNIEDIFDASGVGFVSVGQGEQDKVWGVQAVLES